LPLIKDVSFYDGINASFEQFTKNDKKVFTTIASI